MNIEFIKKVKALAESGVGGEKTNAEELLMKLVKKYEISPDEIENDTVEEAYIFKYTNSYEKQVKIQCIAMVKDNVKGYFKRSKIIVMCTKLEYVEMSALCDFYCHMLKKDLKTFVSAFIQKNNLFGKPSGKNDKEPTKKEQEEYDRMFRMMAGMEAHEYYKKIEAKE